MNFRPCSLQLLQLLQLNVIRGLVQVELAMA